MANFEKNRRTSIYYLATGSLFSILIYEIKGYECGIERAHSSVGQCNRLITERSQVQVLVGPPVFAYPGLPARQASSGTPVVELD